MAISRFADLVQHTAAEFRPPVQSLLDIDFYKFTMGQVIWKNFGNVEVVFELIVRDKDIPVSSFVSQHNLHQALDHARGLKLTATDIYYLRGMNLYEDNMFSEGYLDFLKSFKLPPYELNYLSNGQIRLRFRASWAHASMWETIALTIISELYYRSVMAQVDPWEVEIVYARAMEKVYRKLERIKKDRRIRFADFGQRRRHSFLWQEWVIGLAKQMLGDRFTGTSNTWMAFHHDLPPIGTNAHEMPMVTVALADDKDKIAAQYEMLKIWEKTYGTGLRIFLPDTYGTNQFFRNAPDWLTDWKGFRQDSGVTYTQVKLYMDWLRARDVDPNDKLVIPSDGLDVDQMIAIHDNLHGQVNLSFGWGSLFTNDFRGCHSSSHLRPFSMVCKVVEANGRPCVKLSDNPGKATGPADEVARYLKIFGDVGLMEQVVVV